MLDFAVLMSEGAALRSVACLVALALGAPAHRDHAVARREALTGEQVAAIIAKAARDTPAPLRAGRPSVSTAVELAVSKALSKLPADPNSMSSAPPVIWV